MSERMHRESFLPRLDAARPIEEWIGFRFLQAGLAVHCGAADRARTPHEAEGFADEADVTVALPQVVEVKSSSRAFTGPADFPFPTGPYICAVERWQKRRRKPVAFVIVSQQTGGILVVMSSTFPQWEIDTVTDHARHYSYEAYRAPKDVAVGFDVLLHALAREAW